VTEEVELEMYLESSTWELRLAEQRDTGIRHPRAVYLLGRPGNQVTIGARLNIGRSRFHAPLRRLAENSYVNFASSDSPSGAT